jgi:hypothetical protein
MKEVSLGLMVVMLFFLTIRKEVIKLCARPKTMIFDMHLRKRVALSYRSVAGQLGKVHV